MPFKRFDRKINSTKNWRKNGERNFEIPRHTTLDIIFAAVVLKRNDAARWKRGCNFIYIHLRLGTLKSRKG